MRHIVLALMVALLPLRGWAGDAMAVSVAAAPAAMSDASMPADCPMLKAQTAASQEQGEPVQVAVTGGACELCLLVVVERPQPMTGGSTLSQAVPRGGPARFVSALPAPALEIPIS